MSCGAERRGFLSGFETLKSLAQLPHPSPWMHTACLKMERCQELHLAQVPATLPCPFTWNAGCTWALTSALSTWPQGCSPGFPSALLSPQTVLQLQCSWSLMRKRHTLFSPAPWGPLSTELLLPLPCISLMLHSKLSRRLSCGVIRVSTK